MRIRHPGFNVVILVLSSMTVVYIAYPLITIFIFSEPSSKLLDSLTRPEVSDALVLSLISATISTLLLSLFGIPLAYFLARYENFLAKFLFRIIIIIPLVLPPLATGSLLLGAFGPYSPLVQAFPGIEFTQSMVGVIIAQTYVASPFMILASQVAFESVDESYEKIARILGKSRVETFFMVLLPLARTGIVIGFIMSWVRSIGELGATMMMAYNPHTISIQIFEDNAIGGLRQAVPSIILVILLSIVAVVTIFYFTIRKKQDILKLT
jgi:molybdate/tungstate transport system permease protein